MKILKLAGTAATVLLFAALGSLNVPGIILATLALNAICGTALKAKEAHNGQIHSQEQSGQARIHPAAW